jgi:hypothetical protein
MVWSSTIRTEIEFIVLQVDIQGSGSAGFSGLGGDLDRDVPAMTTDRVVSKLACDLPWDFPAMESGFGKASGNDRTMANGFPACRTIHCPQGAPVFAEISHHAASLDQSDEDHDDCRDEQDVEEAAQCGTGHKTENPQQQQNNGNGH